MFWNVRVCHLVRFFFRWVTSHSSNHGHAVLGKLGLISKRAILYLNATKRGKSREEMGIRWAKVASELSPQLAERVWTAGLGRGRSAF